MTFTFKKTDDDLFFLMAGSFLMIAVVMIYWPVSRFDFVFYDDQNYVFENHYVRMGLSFEGIKWAFTTFHASNWHPLTWMSHMLDVSLYGVVPGKHHMTNVIFHMFNTLLLFTFLIQTTSEKWPSFFVAAFFAFHPLHIESVAWIAERKDVLSAFFWLISILFYVQYIQKRSWMMYAASLLSFACGLMSKPMIVTLPFVLLLLDHWPLKRIVFDKKIIKKNIFIIYEKVPFFLLTSASCFITISAQKSGRALADSNSYPLFFRAGNAVIAYVQYLQKTIWPLKLSVFYPLRIVPPFADILISLFVLVLITGTLIYFVKKLPYGFVGWFWFLGTLIPVIGIIKAGSQSIADRYTYIPHIGLFIAFVWIIHYTFKKYNQLASNILLSFLLIFMIPKTWHQIYVWENTLTLFKNSISIFPQSSIVNKLYGNALLESGDIDAAIMIYKNILAEIPDDTDVCYNIGIAYRYKGDLKAAKIKFLQILKQYPDNVSAHHQLGQLYTNEKEYKKAIRHFNALLSINSRDTEALSCLGDIYYYQGYLDKALKELEKIYKIDPDNIINNYKMGSIFIEEGDYKKAIEYYKRIVSLAPDYKDAQIRYRMLQQRIHVEE